MIEKLDYSVCRKHRDPLASRLEALPTRKYLIVGANISKHELRFKRDVKVVKLPLPVDFLRGGKLFDVQNVSVNWCFQKWVNISRIIPVRKHRIYNLKYFSCQNYVYRSVFCHLYV